MIRTLAGLRREEKGKRTLGAGRYKYLRLHTNMPWRHMSRARISLAKMRAFEGKSRPLTGLVAGFRYREGMADARSEEQLPEALTKSI